MTGLKSENVIAGINEALGSADDDASSGSQNEGSSLPQGYEVTDCSSRVVKFMLSTISRHHDWAGVRR